MPPEPLDPWKKKAEKKHRIRRVNVCGPWCMECRFLDRTLPTAFLIGILICLVYYLSFAAPITFPSAALMKVSPGESTQSVADRLAQKHIIEHPALFVWATKIYDDGRVIPGEYFFPGPQNVFGIARRLVHGDFELVPVRVTIAEGATVRQSAEVLTNKIADFDTEEYLRLAMPKEGYLFPDTYFFLPGEDPTLVIDTMSTNFENKLATIATTTAAFKKPLSDIIVMASLLEKEASDTHSRRVIAGILWHRLAIGMPLQVDAVFPYIIGKNSFQLTRADLKTDSPYNTYTHKGLPPGPIANPGLDSILAAVTPIKSDYLYYLSDMKGNFHYSTTYAGQLANQRRYLP